MIIDIITLFPEMFKGVFSSSIIKIAQEKEKLKINLHNLRDFTQDKHKKVDSPPYGGGPGMVLKCEPLYSAVESIIDPEKRKDEKVILLTPQGKLLNKNITGNLLKNKRLILVCGRYEGLDQRVRDDLIDQEISIGDYVLSGGEIPAMVLVDVLTRLIPGVVGDYESVRNESFENGVLDYPQYTQPRIFRDKRVPEILFSGNHQAIKEWRQQEAMKKTKKTRPDLLKKRKINTDKEQMHTDRKPMDDG